MSTDETVIPFAVAPRDKSGMPVVNTELLDKVREFIGDNLDHWDQHNWSSFPVDSYITLWHGNGELDGRPPCGTTHCFAGWVAELTGARFLSENLVLAPEGMRSITTVRDHPATFVSEYAKTALGLTEHEAAALFFSADDTLEDLDHVIDAIKAGVYRRGDRMTYRHTP